MNRKVYAAGHGHCCGYSNWMSPTGIAKDIEKAELVVGLGGSDVSPKYYNQPDGGFLSCNHYTDVAEYADYQEAIKLGKKIVGICKGAQWLSALAGGAVFQHIEHPFVHPIRTFDGKTLLSNSMHHNLADLSNLKEGEDYKLLAWAESISPCHYNGFKQNIPCHKEPEVVFYPKINAVGFQMHPEMMYRNSHCKETMTWFTDILEKFMSDKL